jgi:hypothetical protein
MAKRPRPSWPYFAPQLFLLFAAIAIFVGAFLPWALVLGQSLRGSPLAVSWVLWGGLMTLAAAIVPWRLLFVVSTLTGGGTAAGVAAWQTIRILDRCPLSLDCLPGPGLGLVLGGGVAGLYLGARFLVDELRGSRPRP